MAAASAHPADGTGDSAITGIVREVYFPAPLIYRRGAIYGNRTLRQSFRNGILDFTNIGIPVSKLGLFLGFQTTKGTGGREGLSNRCFAA